MLVNFILESRNLWKPETGIKDGFQEMEDNKNFHVEHSFRKNTTTLISDVPLLLETFRSIAFHLLSNQIVFKRSVNSKQPMLTITGSHFFNTSYKTWSRFLVCSQFHCLIPQYLFHYDASVFPTRNYEKEFSEENIGYLFTCRQVCKIALQLVVLCMLFVVEYVRVDVTW